MIELIIVAAIGFLLLRATYKTDDKPEISEVLGDKLGRLWQIAFQGMRENKLLRAEKALLTILKIDEKNAAAYNRLGILYAKQKEFKDAIDCFEIASSIEKSASSLHNLGLIYYETGDYNKASTAFEEAIALEDNMAARHIALAKVQEKLGNNKRMIAELVRASQLEPNHETFSLLLKAYEIHDMKREAELIRRRISRLGNRPLLRPNRVARARRVVI
jgi:tetratricopeptide (TPR) repeat protein